MRQFKRFISVSISHWCCTSQKRRGRWAVCPRCLA